MFEDYVGNFPEDFKELQCQNISSKVEKYINSVQAEIEYCSYCQPYESGECIWILGREAALSSVYTSLNIPKILWNEIGPWLYCPHCGKEGFDSYESIGLQEIWILELERKIKKVIQRYKKYFEKFQEFLELYPSLALASPLGRRILKEMGQGQFPVIQIENQVFYRARKSKKKELYKISEILSPPTKLAKDGRYNHPGKRVLYLADSCKGAILEAIDSPKRPQYVNILEFKSQILNNVLDLRVLDEYGEYQEPKSDLLLAALNHQLFERKVKDKKSNWKPEYLITKFIADCAKYHGINAIIYDSVKSHSKNIVIFDPKNPDSIVRPIGSPRIHKYEPPGTNWESLPWVSHIEDSQDF